MKKNFTGRSRCPDRGTVQMNAVGMRTILLTAMLFFPLLAAPLHVAAQEAGNAKSAVGFHVYFGNFPKTHTGRVGNVVEPTVPYVLKPNTRNLDDQLKPYTGYFLVEPVNWRVLAEDAEGILLLSEHTIANWAYHTPGGTVTWGASSMRDSLETRFLLGSTSHGGVKDFFTPLERAAVTYSSLQNPSSVKDVDGITTSDRVFLPAAADTILIPLAADRIATNTVYAASYTNTSNVNEPETWLLRTHGASFFPGLAMTVREESGYVNTIGESNLSSLPVRPALRLSKDKFVLVSDTKQGVGMRNPPLSATPDTLKLTLVDAGNLLLDLTVDVNTGDYRAVVTGNDLNLTYSVVNGGTDNFLSVLVEELGGAAVYYSKLAALPGASSGTVTVPFNAASLTSGTYTVKLFHEQVNASLSEPDIAGQPAVFTVGIAGTPASAAILTHEGTDDNLSDGWVGIAYDDTVHFAGDPSPSVSLLSGTLPPGLVLETSGRLRGTPSTASSYTFTVQANNGELDTETYTVVIIPTSPPDIVSPLGGLIDSCLRNVPYDTVIVANGEPKPTFSIVLGGLPAGLSLDQTTGVISGTPTNEETMSFTVRATNPFGMDDSTYVLKVKLLNNPVAPQFVTKALPRAEAETPYSFRILASGEPMPNIIGLSGLPSGFLIDPGTGYLDGTPSVTSPAGSPYSVLIRLQSSSGTKDSTFLFYIDPVLHAPKLTLTPPLTAPASVGSDPFNITATFDEPVSGLTAADIDVIGATGTVSGVRMGGTPTATVPVRSTIWTFDVTASPANANGTAIRAYVRPNAALGANNVRTKMESDTVTVTYFFDRPTVNFGVADGTMYFDDPNSFTFDIVPNGTGALAIAPYVDGQPLNDTNIDGAIEILRNGDLFTDWDASVSGVTLTGATVTVEGVFG
ncbi:MAG: putative Ig domain-containing protein, partial [Tannerella sp.]|nr:putative Ig domain-containing protein [Tannerella sp.]